MSVYLVVLPKKDSEELNHKDLLNKTAFEYSELFKDVGYKPYIFISDNPYKSGSVVIWDRIDPNSFFYKNSDGVWAVSSSVNTSQSIVENMARRGGKLNYLEPVWGHYTVVRAEMYLSQFQAWNTVPAIEAIHYSEDNDYIYISNRPLPIALAMNQAITKEIQMNEDFLSEYLAFGYSISGSTIYKHVKILLPDEMLNVKNGLLSFQSKPDGMSSKFSENHTQEDAKEHLKSALERSMQRSISNMRGEKIQLRMSGGKDSRLCSLLARPYRNKFFAVNFGKIKETETNLSAIICDYVGIPLEITSPKLVSGSMLRDKVEKTLLLSDGILPSEPHTSIYVGSEPRTNNESIMMGQWPLFKGGYANSMRNEESILKEKLVSIIYPIFKDSHHEYFEKIISNWFESTSSSSSLEKLYLFSRTFRSGRWLQGSIALHARDADILYPISDAEVTAISDALTMFEKVSQSVLYSVMDSIDSYVTNLPLANSRWPVGATNPKGTKINNLYEEIEKLKDFPKFVSREYISAMSNETIHELSKQITESPNLEKYEDILNSEFIDAIFRSALVEVSPPLKMPLRSFKSAIWRLFVADIWLSENWLK